MKNRDCKKWFKTAEITSIAKINVKLQISIYLHLGFYIDFRDLILRDNSMALVLRKLSEARNISSTSEGIGA